ncbi:MAG: ATP-binding protein [Streptosporangiaceae bacterium]
MRVKKVAGVPDVKFCLVFGCEAVSVPVMRRVLGDTLRGLGVDEESVYDILLAATEACTNVLRHGGRDVEAYAVVTSLGPVGCQVEVADEGAGAVLSGSGFAGTGFAGTEFAGTEFAGTEFAGTGPHEVPEAYDPVIAWLPESGRGLAVMRACVDNVTLDSSPGHGTVVRLRKHIRWTDDAPLRNYRAAS